MVSRRDLHELNAACQTLRKRQCSRSSMFQKDILFDLVIFLPHHMPKFTEKPEGSILSAT